MNYKDTKPYMSAFLSVDLLTEFAAFCLTDFKDWRYIHSWFLFSTQLVNCCPHGRRNFSILVYCCPSTVPSHWPPTPYPLFPMYSICRQCVTVWLWGVEGWRGVEMYCGPYPAGVLHSVSDQLQTYKIASPPQTKMTNKDDINPLSHEGKPFWPYTSLNANYCKSS